LIPGFASSDKVMKSYWVTVHVRLREPLASDDGSVVTGYFRVFGMWSDEEDLRNTIASEIHDGAIDWSDTTYELKNLSQMSEDIRQLSVADQPIWYSSGRMFYSDEDE